jgi:hypothetical protein
MAAGLMAAGLSCLVMESLGHKVMESRISSGRLDCGRSSNVLFNGSRFFAKYHACENRKDKFVRNLAVKHRKGQAMSDQSNHSTAVVDERKIHFMPLLLCDYVPI